MNVQSPRTWSIASRLTLWYASSAFLLVVLATGVLYWVLVRNVDREDDQFLVDTVQIFRALIQQRPDDMAALRQEAEWEGTARRYARMYVRVADSHGRTIVETPGATAILDRRQPRPAAADIEPGPGIDVQSPAGTPFRMLAAWAPVGGAGQDLRLIQAVLDRTAEQKLLGEYRSRLWTVLGLALIAAVGVGHTIARRGMRPIQAITATARGIRSSTLDERMSTVGLPTELGTLADTFNQMLGRLEDAFDRLSSLSGDLAHELRTPINNLRGVVEVALGKPRSGDESREILESVLEECVRLSQMIDSLMFLARAESPELQISRMALDVQSEVNALCEFYEPAAAEAGVRLEVTPARDNIVAMLDRTLFQRAVGNVITNALSYTPPGGRVCLSTSRTQDQLHIEITDTGVGISAPHLARISDRFYRVDPSRSSLSGGLGLGLAIVRSILKVHGGTMQILSDHGHGTSVHLLFPGSIVDQSPRRAEVAVAQ